MLDRKQKKDAYRKMLEIRLFEERVAALYAEGRIPGFVHLCSGQEAIAVGAALALQPTDYIVSNHRGHGHHIARGAAFDRMLAELMGKQDGYCQGRGGCLHLTPTEVGSLGANGIVAAGTIIANGAALSAQLRGSDQVTLCFFGEGATGQGMFHEALNLAAVWKLPVIFLCENNRYAEATPYAQGIPVPAIADRAKAYGIPGITVDGNDVLTMYQTVEDALTRARRGEGPTLIEGLTYRWRGHYEGDPETYRTAEEVQTWHTRCPIERFKTVLTNEGLLTEEEDQHLRQTIRTALSKAETFALQSPFPPASGLEDDVFAPDTLTTAPFPQVNTHLITGLAAIQEALREEMRHDPSVFLMGEDMEQAVFGVTSDLFEEFGPERVRNSPISESALVGSAIGAALTGMRPVVEIMFQDFLFTCMDAIANQAAKIRYMTGGSYHVPLVIRSPGGSGFAAAAQHSQSVTASFLNIPGLKIVCPSTPADMKGLMKAAIRDNNPVLFLENKSLYYEGGEVPDEDYVIPLGLADIKRPGKDVTVVAILAMVPRVLTAAEDLIREGIDIEVIDPRTLVPLDKATIFTSLKKTNRLVIVEEGPLTGGVGAEIAALAASEALDYLDAPVIRVAAPNVPIPFSPPLEDQIAPDLDRIKIAIRQVVA